MSLLDPVAFKRYLTFVLQLPSVYGKPGFESSNGIDLFTGQLFGAWCASESSQGAIFVLNREQRSIDDS